MRWPQTPQTASPRSSTGPSRGGRRRSAPKAAAQSPGAEAPGPAAVPDGYDSVEALPVQHSDCAVLLNRAHFTKSPMLPARRPWRGTR